MTLQGKVAIVTGAGGGMGTAICEVLAGSGVSLGIVDVAADRLEMTAASVREHGGNVLTFAHDVGDADAVAATVETVAEQLGRLDILVNTAGIGHEQDVKVADTPVEVFDLVMNVNLRGAFLFCKFTIPHLLAAGGGAIVNISSAGGLPGIKTQGSTSYRVSKTGMLGLTRAVAAHYAEQSIRCTSICPGP